MCPNMCFSRKTCSLSMYNVKGELDCFEEVPLQKNMTNVACFHGQHFLCSEGI